MKVFYLDLIESPYSSEISLLFQTVYTIELLNYAHNFGPLFNSRNLFTIVNSTYWIEVMTYNLLRMSSKERWSPTYCAGQARVQVDSKPKNS